MPSFYEGLTNNGPPTQWGRVKQNIPHNSGLVASNEKSHLPLLCLLSPYLFSSLPLKLIQRGDMSLCPVFLQLQAPTAEGALSQEGPDKRNCRSWRLRGRLTCGKSLPNTPLWLQCFSEDGWVDGPIYLMQRCQTRTFWLPTLPERDFRSWISKFSVQL